MHLKLPQPSDVLQKTVLVRVDYNVALEERAGEIVVAEDKRLRDSLATLQFLMEQQAKIVLIAHLGRPEGKDPKLSLRPIADYLQTSLNLPVTFVPETVGPAVQTALNTLLPGQLLLLENLRYHPEEEANDPEFARQLTQGCGVFINEAFSAAHRAHASVVGVTQHLPSFAGFSLNREVQTLTKLMANPARPLVVVLGGAKISDKVGAVTHLADVADIVLVGGAVANNFLKADGLETHHSFLEEASSDLQKQNIDYVKLAGQLLEAHKTERMLLDGHIPLPKILYPIDVLAAPHLETADPAEILTIDLTHAAADTPDDRDLMYLDIGPKTQQLFGEILTQAGTIFWNGPMGVWENPLFAAGTRAVGQAVAANAGYSVIGGGDTIAAVDHLGLTGFEYVSAAGGAALDFLSGKLLPGIAPLIQR